MNQEPQESLAESIIKRIPGKVKGNSLATFTRRFYAGISLEDMESQDLGFLAAEAEAVFKFIQSHRRGSISIAHSCTGQFSTFMILNDDMPFLVDSVTAELARLGVKVFDLIHPVLRLRRDKSGKFQEFAENGGEALDESLIYVRAGVTDKKLAANIAAGLENVLESVQTVVSDWRGMLARVDETVKSLELHKNREEAAETRDFIEWLADHHFTFLGYAEYDFGGGKTPALKAVKGSELGIFRPEVKAGGVSGETLEFSKNGRLLEITKSSTKAMVHRSVYMDSIGVKKLGRNGEILGERRFFGLFASSVYYQSTNQIPVIRRKVHHVISASGHSSGSHSGKILQFIMDSYPRDEIFQSSEADLLENGLAILRLIERPRVGLFIRKDSLGRFLSCLIYVPKERFDTNLRHRIQEILETSLGGKVTEYYTQITDSPLSRLHLIIKGGKPGFDVHALQAQIAEAASGWTDDLYQELKKHSGKNAERLFSKYESAFPKSYTAIYRAYNAVFDILKIEEATASGKITFELYTSASSLKNFNGHALHLKLYSPASEMLISDVLPVLENMGLKVRDEHPFLVKPGSENGIWIRDFLVEVPGKDFSREEIAQIKQGFGEALSAVFDGSAENDGFNRLILEAGLPWREVALLRSLSKYLKQAGISYSQEYIQASLAKYPQIARLLTSLFNAMFDPAAKSGREKEVESISAKITSALSAVADLNDDRIIRRFLETAKAMLRTNFFQNKPYISFKLDSRKVPELPLPRPLYEIFVYSPRVEGIHLRGGKVARGGLRWSDRKEDFRTEILGLMKAQMVKNSVIVPVGSKGGFIVKQPPATGGKAAYLAEGVECYKTFLRGILDITDNIAGGKITPPARVTRRDGDDPYLVVAADKGTAAFSDYANSVSAEYGFWLGDAFASGGSAGYDHKKMGITAKGGWVSVKRHFREIGLDVDTEDFTAAGIGDMAGDVFGNGMLMSRHIRLIAAFNHIHIFIDPAPDAAKSFAERKRLFETPGSAWTDYDRKLISKGGGVFERSAKSIPVTAEMKKALGITAESLSPDELIKAILLAPVDLLWNGGIGTYVKSAAETHQDAGDKSNDSLRVNGGDLRCKVVGEGGNLGFTQQGRVEYAMKGGRINTDAIDNSGGVDCSDHEVNIKIALASRVESGKLSLKSRDEFLSGMTDEVASLVLRDNYLQTMALSVAELQGANLAESQAGFMRRLEAVGLLDRKIEFLPTDEELSRRQSEKRGLTRPELAVLLAYSKMSLYGELLASDLPDDPYFSRDLSLYFPKAMREKFSAEIEKHRLRREIIATFVTNSMVNRVGSTFFHNVTKDTGMPAADVARAYTAVRDIFSLRALWVEIESLDGKVPAEAQYSMLLEISKFIERMTFWFLRNLPHPLKVEDAVKRFSGDVQAFSEKLSLLLSGSEKKNLGIRLEALESKGVPTPLARKIAELAALSSSCDVAVVSKSGSYPVHVVGQVYFEIGERLSLSWLKEAASRLPADNYWLRLAARNITDSLFDEQRKIAAKIIKTSCKGDSCKGAVDSWCELKSGEIARHDDFIAELRTVESLDLSMLVAATRRVEALGLI